LTLEVEAGAVIVGEDTALSTMLGELQVKLGLLLGEDTQLAETAPEMGVGSEHQPNIEALIAQVQSTARHVRTVCDNLRPTYLNDPLTLTLQATVQKTQAAHPAVVVTLDCLGEELPAIPDEVKIACTQIMRQAVDNALAHAAPTQIGVTLQYRPDETITLTVRDNGRGFVPRPRREWRTGSHHGLANMHERAELVGGELQVLSAPGQGTTILVCIPPQIIAQEQP
jgi:signal transduction histidine kinase